MMSASASQDSMTPLRTRPHFQKERWKFLLRTLASGIRTNTDDAADNEIFEVNSELSVVAGVFGNMILGLS